MKVGIPRALLYEKYDVLAKTYFEEIGAEIVVSPDTNKQILDEGVKCCVDEACLPVKIFHGHINWLKTRCDAILIPRLMSIEKTRSICPMFCGLIEMVKSGIPELPALIDESIYSFDKSSLYEWCKNSGKSITQNKRLVKSAFEKAFAKQNESKVVFDNVDFPLKVALIGHTYNVNDNFINMNTKSKLRSFGLDVLTEQDVLRKQIDEEVSLLYKKPFWSHIYSTYGVAVSLYKAKKIDGIVYISSFCCGIDSVATELIGHGIRNLPLMVIKIDEHTGEAGIDTRIEAFAEMLKRRALSGNNNSSSRQRIYCSEGTF